MIKNNNLKLAFIFLAIPFSSIVFGLTNTINSKHISTETKEIDLNIQNDNYNNSVKFSVSPENYKDALSDYMRRNSNKFDINNPSSILTEFMNEYDLDYITVSNY